MIDTYIAPVDGARPVADRTHIIVLCFDPLAIALTAAASARR
jgi:hypothetical protein